MKLLGTEIEPGSSHNLELNIAKLYTNTDLTIPVIVHRSKENGPVVLITAGLHGDEVNGVEIVRQLVEKKHHKVEKGTTICIPLINVFGFINKSRFFPDGRDLNRVFPGSKRGSLASRFAHKLMVDIVPHVDFILDFHTGGAQRFNMTHIRINPDEHLLKLVKKLPVPFILNAENRKDTFRHACSLQDKKVILFEGGKTLFLDKVVTKKGIETTRKLLAELGMNDAPKIKTSSPLVIQKTKWVRASKSGMFRCHIDNGSKVEKGQVLGTISDPYGSMSISVKAPITGYLICLNHLPLVNQGDALFNLGIE